MKNLLLKKWVLLLAFLFVGWSAMAQDVLTGSYNTTVSVNDSHVPFNPTDVAFSDDGMKMFVSSSYSDHVATYDLTTAFDIATASYNTHSVATNSVGVTFSDDGMIMFCFHVSPTNVYVSEYNLTAPYVISTTLYPSEYFNVAVQTGAGTGMTDGGLQFSSDGMKLFIIEDKNSTIFQYDLTVAYDITTATYSNNSFSVATEENKANGLCFSDDGLKLYVIGYQNGKVQHYNLSSAFDITTASFASNLFSPYPYSALTGIAFSADNSKLFISDNSGNAVDRFDVVLIPSLSAGTGRAIDPYIIATKTDLKTLSENQAYWQKGLYFQQSADVVLEPTDFQTGGDFYNGGKGFSPIGNGTTNFKGSYDGNEHKIAGLYINNPTGGQTALFGYLSADASVNKLGIENCEISGYNQVAGIAGFTVGTITECYTTGELTAGYGNIGGIAGYVSGSISDCYSHCSVTCNGIEATGGLIGNFYTGTVSNSYCTGAVDQTVSSSNDGAFAGKRGYGTVNNCFFNSEINSGLPGIGTSTSGTGSPTGKTTAQMQTQGTFTGWDFTTTPVWKIDANNNGYPYLAWQTFAPTLPTFSAGTGTELDPYIIATLDDLKILSENDTYWASGLYFEQTANLTFTATDFQSGGDFYNGGEGFIPIGNGTTQFQGNYDGGDFTIDGLFINSATSFAGMFGYVATAGVVNNLGVTNVNFTGQGDAGGLVAVSSGTIDNCYSTGTVTTSSSEYYEGAGGLVGSNYGTISNSYSTCTVNGDDEIGGFVGINNTNATITKCYSNGSAVATGDNVGGFVGINISMMGDNEINNCYSLSSVQGTGSVGGFVGKNEMNVGSAYIKMCYSAGNVTGASNVGGFVGTDWSDAGNIINSFFDADADGLVGTISGTTEGLDGGAIGKTTAQMQDNATFTAATWVFPTTWTQNSTDNGGYPALAWQGFTHGDPLPTFSAGDGTSGNPYIIATLEDLKILSENDTYWASGLYFEQTADLTFTATDFQSGGDFYNLGDHDNDAGTPDKAMGFSPIGSQATQFLGQYDGGGHTIVGLYINRPGFQHIGLFGYIGTGAGVKDLGTLQADITGSSFVGGFCGLNEGTIDNCFASGSATSINSYVGGFCGENAFNINNCYAGANTQGSGKVGGFCGSNDGGTINNSGSISNVTGGSNTNGFLGDDDNGTINNSFWDVDVDGITGNNSGDDNFGATAKTTAEMKDLCTFTDAGWDFETTPLWTMNSTDNFGYPALAWQGYTHTATCLPTFSAGTGTELDPYIIATLEDLKILSENDTYWASGLFFEQTADLTFAATDFLSGGDFYNGGEGFIPIGNGSIKFQGNYDGGDFTIDGLYINRPDDNFMGFFGYTNSATIGNLGIINAEIYGEDNIGVFVGQCESTNITNCFSSGDIDGDNAVGGFVGKKSSAGTISNCYSSSVVSGRINVGGFIAANWGGLTEKCYATGEVTSDSYLAGGFVGEMTSNPTIENCYSTGNIVGSTTQRGGFLGNAYNGTITNCYSTGTCTNAGFAGTSSATINNSFFLNTAGPNNGFATAKTTAQMQDLCTFTDAGWDFETTPLWTMNATDNYGYPALAWQGYTHTATCLPTFSAGTGTELDPYIIATLEDLKVLSENEEYWASGLFFEQTANLTFDATDFQVGGDFYNGGEGFIPIGNETTKFEGHYDGGDFSIDGLFINRPTAENVSLFGYVESGATVENLGVQNCTIAGNKNVSAVVATLSGTISNCYSTGSLDGDYGFIGGIAGFSNGSISNCYSHCEIECDGSYVGGFLGRNVGTVTNCYSTGNVISGASTSAGGFLGGNVTTVTNCFWDTETSNQATSAGTETGKTTAEMQDNATFTAASWVFPTTWTQNATDNNGYPALAWQGFAHGAAPTNPTWNGTAWSPSAPTASDDVIINGNYTGAGFTANSLTINSGFTVTLNADECLEVAGEITNNGNGLVLNNGAALVDPANTTPVSGLYKKTYTLDGNGWGFAATPVGTFTVQNVFNGDYVYWYDEAATTQNDAWINLAFGDNFEDGTGYLFNSGSGSKTFTGIFGLGTYTSGVQIPALQNSYQGFNLIGNPYAAYLDWDGTTKTNLDGNKTVWIWNGSSYSTYVEGDNYGIPPAASFFVQATGSSEVAFGDADKECTSSSKDSGFPELRLMASGNGLQDYVRVINPGDFEAFSAKMFTWNEEVPQIYIAGTDEDYAIQRMDGIENGETIPVGFVCSQSGTYELSTPLHGLGENVQVYLEDLATGSFTELTGQNSYTFSHTAGDEPDRFVLHFATTITGAEGITEDAVNIYSYAEKAYINTNGETAQSVEVYTLSGRLIYSDFNSFEGIRSFEVPATGVYIIKVQTENGATAQRVVIN